MATTDQDSREEGCEREELDQHPDPRQVPHCFCGIEIERANSLCTEADCFYKR